MKKRIVYVVSDLHIGGDYPDTSDPTSGGFRICTRVDAISEFVASLTGRAEHDIELVP